MRKNSTKRQDIKQNGAKAIAAAKSVPAPVPKEAPSLSAPLRLLLVAIAAFMPYISTLHYPFAYMDDNLVVLLQEKLLADADVKKAFQSEFFNQEDEADFFYRPIQTVTFIMDYQLAGTRMLQYRLTGILVHALVSVVLLYFLGALGVSAWVAFLLGLLFAVHPALAPVQLFIAARADSLVALFLMLSFLALFRYLKAGNILWLAAHLLVFALALFTKETAVFLPVLATVFILHYPPLVGRQQAVLLRLVPFWLLLGVLWFVLRQAALTNPPVIETGMLLSQFFGNLPGIFLYIGVLFTPLSLPSILNLSSPYEFAGISIALGMALLLRKRLRVPSHIIWFAALWYCLFVLVTFLSPSNLPLFDFLLNRTYVPAIGIFLILGYLIDAWAIPPSRFTGVVFLCLPLLIYLNVGYTSSHSDRISTWNTFAKEAPDSYHVLKHQLLAYEDAKRQHEVPDLYLKAARLSPSDKYVNYSAGAVLFKQGQREAAFPFFQRELAINPNHAESLNYIGVYYEGKDQLKLAKQYYLKSVEADSSCKDCLWNSARACAMTADRALGKNYIRRMHTLGCPIPIKAVEDYLTAKP
jgi:tetratricopeptide (TPR) repeat protein